MAGAALWLLAAAAQAQIAPTRYALFMADEPVAARSQSRTELRSAAAQTQRTRIEDAQRALRSELDRRGIQVTGASSTLLNAVYVNATPDRIDELRALPGVIGVVPMRRHTREMNRATTLMNAPTAWNSLGGMTNAGKGIKIAILDSGIDQKHPAFQDSTLTVPAGFPICSGSDCAFTNNKVIVARSYVPQIAAGSNPNNPAADSRPDDYSPRDRSGHGTAVASCAAANVNTGSVTFNGMAPKAYLGNYKVWGTPGVNDAPTSDIFIMAIEDALADGMDIANVSSGATALSGPLDTGSVCGNSNGVPCDPEATAYEQAVKKGMIIVVSAGNDGASAYYYPNPGSISSPANAPSVIAAGATTNSHVFQWTASITDASAPSNVKNLAGQYGDSVNPIGASVAPLIDVSTLGNDGLACTALPANSLTGAYALIKRGTCTYYAKSVNAENAGALGIVFYMADATAPVHPEGVDSFYGPTMMLSNADGTSLKNYLASHSGANVMIDPAGLELNVSPYNQVASYSSSGPNVGDGAIKPDLIATGGYDLNLGPDPNDYYLSGPSGLVAATQSYDPNGDIYSATGYAAVNGTSFAAPITAGAAAMVLQAHKGYTPAQVKSALTNQAAQDTTSESLYNGSVDARYVGAGRLDAGAAISATVTSDPATVSFGVVNGKTLPISKTLTINNAGTGSLSLTVTVAAAQAASGTTVTVDKTSFTLAAGASTTLQVNLTGKVPLAGSYSGGITIQGSNVSLRIPYLFVVSDFVAINLYTPLSGFDGVTGTDTGAFFAKVTDRYGIPVAGSPVVFSVSPAGSMTLSSVSGAPSCTPNSSTNNVTCKTDNYGVAYVDVVLGKTAGTATLTATAAGVFFDTSIYMRPAPAITTAGVVSAANSSVGVAPGSYVAIYGSNLADPGVQDAASTAILPLVLDQVTVGFDVPSAKISVPARIVYVDPTHINIQVPWELQGQASAQMKVTINQSSYGNVVTVPIADYAPAFFEGGGVVAARNAAYAQILSTNPAQRGQIVQLYANGLGPVNNAPASGDPASGTTLAQTKTQPVVMIGGQQAPVQFSGLAPGFPGLYQVNVTVPSGISAGSQPITIAIGGKTSPASTLPVQ